jgi:hypothetical protein
MQVSSFQPPLARKQVAKKSASKGPRSSEVDHFRSIYRQVGAGLLRKLEFRTFDSKLYVAVGSFENVFADFMATFDCSTLLRFFGSEVPLHFLFDKWTVSHVSMPAANLILRSIKNTPEMFRASADQGSILQNSFRQKISGINFHSHILDQYPP